MLFDIGGVLERVDDGAWQSAFVARWQERAGLTPEEYRSRLRDVELPPIDRVVGTESAYWRLVGEALGLDAAETARMRAEMWDAYCGEPNAELVAYAAMLRPRAGVAILSNSVDGAREEEERRYGFSAVFDPICYSHELVEYLVFWAPRVLRFSARSSRGVVARMSATTSASTRNGSTTPYPACPTCRIPTGAGAVRTQRECCRGQAAPALALEGGAVRSHGSVAPACVTRLVARSSGCGWAGRLVDGVLGEYLRR